MEGEQRERLARHDVPLGAMRRAEAGVVRASGVSLDLTAVQARRFGANASRSALSSRRSSTASPASSPGRTRTDSAIAAAEQQQPAAGTSAANEVHGVPMARSGSFGLAAVTERIDVVHWTPWVWWRRLWGIASI